MADVVAFLPGSGLSQHGGDQGGEVRRVAELDLEGVALLHVELEEGAALLLRVDEFRQTLRLGASNGE